MTVDSLQPPADLSSSRARYADWKAPAGDSELLIWPAPGDLLRQTLINRDRLAKLTSARLLNVPLSEVRRHARAWLGHTGEGPLIATGHQTELWHPGVWVKNAVIHTVAERLAGDGAAAFHFAVDTDSPKHLQLRWPGGDDVDAGRPGIEPLTDDPAATSAAWAGWVAAPSPAHLAHLQSRFSAASRAWGFSTCLPEILDELRRLSLEQPRLPAALMNALHRLDWSLGLRYHAMLTSPLLESPAFLLLAAHVIANARAFAAQYNDALHAYRTDHAIKAPGRPMPDLFASPTAVELPFWLDDLATGARTRPSAFDQPGGGFVLKLVNGEEIAFTPDEDGWQAATRLQRFFAGTAHRLAPRALTLTMFLRVCAADQFVHGIGGGRYDQVLDRLINSHFRVPPPAFSVATATLRFPSSSGRARACVACVEQEARRSRHAILGRHKTDLLRAIEAHPRRSPERYRAFVELQTALRQAWMASGQEHAWQDRIAETRRQEQRDAVTFDRELFYALQPRDRLTGLIEQVRQAFA